MPAAWARAAIDANAANPSSVVHPWFFVLNVSVLTTTTLISASPAAAARSKPRSFRTSPT